jgi:hypothetical protein
VTEKGQTNKKKKEKKMAHRVVLMDARWCAEPTDPVYRQTAFAFPF